MAGKIKITKQQKQLIVIVLVLIVLYFIWKRSKTSETDQISKQSTSTGEPAPTSAGSTVPAWQKKYDALPSVGDDTALKRGTKAKEVWRLQVLYNDNIAKKEGRSKIDVDGIFGPQTEGAVKYVTEQKYTYVTLGYWLGLVKLTKAQRVAHFSSGESGIQTTFTTLQSPFLTNPYPAESTFVAP